MMTFCFLPDILQILVMKNFLFVIPAACVQLLVGTACNSQNVSPKPAGETEKIEVVKKDAKGKTQFREGADFVEFTRARVADKAFADGAEAFSVLVPKTWKHEGEVIWNPPGSGCDGTNNRFRASSPDDRFHFEIYPTYVWSWSDNPALQQYQTDRPGSHCSQGRPFDAETYVRTMFAEQELNGAEVLSVKENPAVIAQMAETNAKGRAELMNYGASDVQFFQSAVNATLRLNNKKEALVLCGVSTIQTVIPNVYDGTYTKSYTTQASQRIVFTYPEGEHEQATAMLSVIVASIRTNPSWKDAVNQFWQNVRARKHVAHLGTLRSIDARTREIGNAAIKSGQERLNNMDTQMRSWEQRQQSQDRMHTNFIKTIREVEHYRDETGKVELVSGYNHAWSRSDGSSYLMSNNPNFVPSSAFLDPNWKEMQKVD